MRGWILGMAYDVSANAGGFAFQDIKLVLEARAILHPGAAFSEQRQRNQENIRFVSFAGGVPYTLAGETFSHPGCGITITRYFGDAVGAKQCCNLADYG